MLADAHPPRGHPSVGGAFFRSFRSPLETLLWEEKHATSGPPRLAATGGHRARHPPTYLHAGVKGLEARYDRNLRILECGRLQDFEASGCRLARLDLREGVQARYQACCEGTCRVQWSIYTVGACYLAFGGPFHQGGMTLYRPHDVAVVDLRRRGVRPFGVRTQHHTTLDGGPLAWAYRTGAMRKGAGYYA